MAITLRKYQENQLKFLLERSEGCSQLFDKNIGLCSPTGSGKSYVMLSFIKKYFEEHDHAKIFISTGFNNLVAQFYEDAKKIGVPCLVLAGKSNCVCTDAIRKHNQNDEMKYTSENAFVPEPPKKYRCSSGKCYDCKLQNTFDCIYCKVTMDIINSDNILIITNHSTLLANKNFFEENTIGGFIDECQTFADFYESYLKTEVNFPQLKNIYQYMEKDFGLRANPFTKIFKRACINGTLTKSTIEKVLYLNTMKKNYKGETKRIKDCYPIAARNMIDYIDTEPQVDNYIYPQIFGSKHMGLCIDRFFDIVELNLPVCITSATIDSYTMSIFNNIHKSDVYYETECKTIDYTKSSLYLYNGFTKENVEHFLDLNSDKNHGLILSTRLDLLDTVPGDRLGEYEIIYDKENFVDGKKQILFGSRSLFQGIDINEVEFVLLNKIPFSRYDEAYKKKMRFFEARGKQPFTFYTKPYTENQLVQSMGRLWRNPGDHGNIAIFDSNACIKHASILKGALNCREGIRCFWYKNNEITEWRI